MGTMAPPFGVNLFATCTVARIPLGQTVGHLIPFVLVTVGCLMVITYVPELSLALRDLVYAKQACARIEFVRSGERARPAPGQRRRRRRRFTKRSGKRTDSRPQRCGRFLAGERSRAAQSAAGPPKEQTAWPARARGESLR